MKLSILLLLAAATAAHAQYRINPAAPYAYGANTGWLNAAAATGTSAARIGPCVCAGFIYSANCGWINLGDGEPANGTQYANTDGADSGVNLLPDGKLRGLAWGANIGWINFEATGNPRIDPATSQVLGTVWSASTGWISFDTAQTDLKITTQDTDGDTIPDAWELLYAPNLTTLAANKDSDGDGSNDIEEYAADTDPMKPADLLQIVNLNMPSGAFGTLRWTSKGSRSYRVQSSPDLQSWQFLSPNAIFGHDGSQTTASVPISSQRLFFRVIPLKPPAGE